MSLTFTDFTIDIPDTFVPLSFFEPGTRNRAEVTVCTVTATCVETGRRAVAHSRITRAIYDDMPREDLERWILNKAKDRFGRLE